MVEIYEDLTNADEKIRLKAAHNLLSEFIHQGKASGEQLNEIVRRLIRGLCSSRKAARLGFSIALTELLVEILGPRRKHVEGFQTVAEVIETLKRQTHVAGNVSGQVRSVVSILAHILVLTPGISRKSEIISLDAYLGQKRS